MPIPSTVSMIVDVIRTRSGGPCLTVAALAAAAATGGCTTPRSLEDDRRLAFTVDAEPTPPPEIAFAFGLGTTLPETALAGVEP